MFFLRECYESVSFVAERFLLSMLFSIEDNYNNYDNFFFNTNVHKLAVNFS